MATAASLMSGSESVSTPSMSKITASIFRSSPMPRQTAEKKSLPQPLSRGELARRASRVMTRKSYTFVNDLWNEAEASKLDPVGRLVYRSNKLGADQRITNTGGGNTSSKITEKDPLTGEPVEVLWVKGSGGDLRTSGKENFSSLYQDKLLSLQKVYAARPQKGPKTQAEDDMVAMYNHCTFN